jgi:hypothetical protein
MVAYPHVVPMASGYGAFYNGNGYGRTGVGLATRTALPSVAALANDAAKRTPAPESD